MVVSGGCVGGLVVGVAQDEEVHVGNESLKVILDEERATREGSSRACLDNVT